jgi:hypothetical protein
MQGIERAKHVISRLPRELDLTLNLMGVSRVKQDKVNISLVPKWYHFREYSLQQCSLDEIVLRNEMSEFLYRLKCGYVGLIDGSSLIMQCKLLLINVDVSLKRL